MYSNTETNANFISIQVSNICINLCLRFVAKWRHTSGSTLLRQWLIAWTNVDFLLNRLCGIRLCGKFKTQDTILHEEYGSHTPKITATSPRDR